jgi:hypothetical protein
MQTHAREAYLSSLKEKYSVEIARTRDSIVQLSGNDAAKTTKLFLESRLGRLERRHKELGMEVSSAPDKEIKIAEPEVTPYETDLDAIRDAVYGMTGKLVPYSMMPKYWKELTTRCAAINMLSGEYATPDTLDKMKKMQQDLDDLVNDIKNEASVNPYGYNAAFCGVSLEPGLSFENKPQTSRHKHIKKRRRGMSYDERKAAFDAGVKLAIQDRSGLWDAPGGLSIRPESNW